MFDMKVGEDKRHEYDYVKSFHPKTCDAHIMTNFVCTGEREIDR